MSLESNSVNISNSPVATTQGSSMDYTCLNPSMFSFSNIKKIPKPPTTGAVFSFFVMCWEEQTMNSNPKWTRNQLIRHFIFVWEKIMKEDDKHPYTEIVKKSYIDTIVFVEDETDSSSSDEEDDEE